MLTSRIPQSYNYIQGLRLEHHEAQLRSSLIDVENFEGDYSIAMVW